MTEKPDRRKLNDVFTKPCCFGIMTICGVIGNGKTREEVILKKHARIDGTDEIKWLHHRGEMWRNLKPLTEVE